MKIHLSLKVALVTLLTVCGAGAFQLNDLKGSWSGNYTATQYGDVILKYGFDLTINRLPDGGFVIIEKFNSGSVRHVFKNNGTYSIAEQGGASESGTWKMVKGKVLVVGRYKNPAGDYGFSGMIDLPDKTHLKYTKTYSFGGVKYGAVRN